MAAAMADAYVNRARVVLPPGALPVEITQHGLIYLHNNLFRIFPGGSLLHLPASPAGAAALNARAYAAQQLANDKAQEIGRAHV